MATLLDVAFIISFQGSRAGKDEPWVMSYSAEMLRLLPVCRALYADDRITKQLARVRFVRKYSWEHTLLQHAAHVGNIRRVDELLLLTQKFPRADIVIDTGRPSPLAYAVSGAHEAISHALIAAGASCRIALACVFGKPQTDDYDEAAGDRYLKTEVESLHCEAREELVRVLIGDGLEVHTYDVFKIALSLHMPDLVTRYGAVGIADWREREREEEDYDDSLRSFLNLIIHRLGRWCRYHTPGYNVPTHRRIETGRALVRVLRELSDEELTERDDFTEESLAEMVLQMLSATQDTETMIQIFEAWRPIARRNIMAWAYAGAGLITETTQLLADGAHLRHYARSHCLHAIMFAAEMDKTDMVRFLLRRELDRDVNAEEYDSLDTLACLGGAVFCNLASLAEELLVKYAAIVDFNALMTDEGYGYCKSPLSIACEQVNVDMVQLLLDKGLTATTVLVLKNMASFKNLKISAPLTWVAAGFELDDKPESLVARTDDADDRVSILQLLFKHGATTELGDANAIAQVKSSPLVARALAANAAEAAEEAAAAAAAAAEGAKGAAEAAAAE